MNRQSYFVITIGFLIVFLSMGTRQSFGIFLKPVVAELSLNRETFSLASALQSILIGFPLAGMLADRFGSRWITLVGALGFSGGMLWMSQMTSISTLFASFGVLIGLAASATGLTVVLGAVAQVTPPEKQSTVFGLMTAAGSLGMFLVVRIAGWMLETFGWRQSFLIMAVVVGIIGALALSFPANDRKDVANASAEDGMLSVLLKARKNASYWLLNAGFFVCGFHVAFIATHLPAYLSDNSVSPSATSWALALIGLANLVGSSMFGYLGDRYRKKYLLSTLYALRAVVISLFLFLPLTDTTAMLFGGTIGFLWLATVPLTSGTISKIFGSRYLSTLFGITFFSHQIGAFLGVWLGGRIYDANGTYDPIWVAGIILGIVAAFIHLPITDTPVVKPALQTG